MKHELKIEIIASVDGKHVSRVSISGKGDWITDGGRRWTERHLTDCVNDLAASVRLPSKANPSEAEPR